MMFCKLGGLHNKLQVDVAEMLEEN